MPATRPQTLPAQSVTSPSGSHGARSPLSPAETSGSAQPRGARAIPAFPRPVLRLFALILLAAALAFFVSQLAAAETSQSSREADTHKIVQDGHRAIATNALGRPEFDHVFSHHAE